MIVAIIINLVISCVISINAKHVENDTCPLFKSVRENMWDYASHFEQTYDVPASRKYGNIKFPCGSMKEFQSRFNAFNRMGDMQHPMKTWYGIVDIVSKNFNLTKIAIPEIEEIATGIELKHDADNSSIHGGCPNNYNYNITVCQTKVHNIIYQYIYLHDQYTKIVDNANININININDTKRTEFMSDNGNDNDIY